MDHDCIVIGAGFSGLRMLLEARRRGLSAHLIEAGSDVGGVWYWNRYPGARTDAEAWGYSYHFDDGLLRDWVWPERYADQPTLLAYLGHVADRFDLRRDIEFDTRVVRAVRDDAANVWTVHTDDGRSSTCRYLIPAVGPLSAPLLPSVPGLDAFRGECHLTARWPADEVDFAGKRVAVVGTGSSGVQVIPQVAQTAAHLTVFQRTPNYVLPARNGPIDDQQQKAIAASYPTIREQVRRHPFGFPMEPAGRVFDDVGEAEAQRVLERGWEAGGFHFVAGTFDDLVFDQRSNDRASEFIRDRIRAIVCDPRTAELLVPTSHSFGAKRPPVGHHYFEAYNRANVTLVDVGANPLAEITATGVRLADGSTHDVDMLILATGFDSGGGAFSAIDIRGSDGTSLADAWAPGAAAYLGVAVPGFPNMFVLGGPGAPFGNFPPVGECVAEWLADVFDHLGRSDAEVIEADRDATDAWVERLRQIAEPTVLSRGAPVNSWFLGANVPGRTPAPVFWFGGLPGYLAELEYCREHGWAGFTLRGAPATV